MISTSVTNNITTVTSNYVTTTEFAAPTLRARTVVISAKKLKPSTTMNLFISGIEANMYYAPCVMIEISMVGTNQFLDASTSGNVIDNLPMRTTTANSYDTINVGEIVASGNIVYGPQSWFPTTGLFGGGWLNMGNFRGNTSGWLGGNATLVSGGYAVVIADMTIYDPVSKSNKRILYVTNYHGTFTGTLKGLTSNNIATIVSVTAGTMTTNSLGDLFGVIQIPSFTFKSGNNSILLTDSAITDPNSATTFTDTGYTSNGVVDTYTTHTNYQTQAFTTITNTTNIVRPASGGPGFLGVIGSGSFFGF